MTTRLVKVTYQGHLEALTSVSNAHRESGPGHLFRRELIVTPSWETALIPVLSGSTIRGALRRIATELVVALLQEDPGLREALIGSGHMDPQGRLSVPVNHALRTGGSLRPTRKAGEVLTGDRQARLRDAIPMLALFGTTGGGRMVAGKLIVDKGIPLGRQTARLAPYYGIPTPPQEELPSVQKYLQNEYYSRVDDVSGVGADSTIPTQNADPRQGIPRGSGKMRWYHETLAAGTVLLHSVIGDPLTPSEVSFLDDLMRVVNKDFRVGGQKARGLGRVQTVYTRRVTDVSGNPDDTHPVDPELWRATMTSDPTAVAEALQWL